MPFDLRRRTLLAASAALPFLPLRARAQGVVKVGSTPTGIPFTFLDIKTSTLTGFMVDLAAAVAKNAGFAMDVQPTPFAALIPSLTTSRIDLISAAMFDTAVRREQVD
ncbi:MAG: transporter substrate-binding domain-containing protein, partial [Alphaproteobacteria bacterium]